MNVVVGKWGCLAGERVQRGYTTDAFASLTYCGHGNEKRMVVGADTLNLSSIPYAKRLANPKARWHLIREITAEMRALHLAVPCYERHLTEALTPIVSLSETDEQRIATWNREEPGKGERILRWTIRSIGIELFGRERQASMWYHRRYRDEEERKIREPSKPRDIHLVGSNYDFNLEPYITWLRRRTHGAREDGKPIRFLTFATEVVRLVAIRDGFEAVLYRRKRKGRRQEGRSPIDGFYDIKLTYGKNEIEQFEDDGAFVRAREAKGDTV